MDLRKYTISSFGRYLNPGIKMKISFYHIFFFIIFTFYAFIENNYSQIIKKEIVHKTNNYILGQPGSTRININNISTVIRNNGISDNDNSHGASFYFPKNSDKTLVYTSGLLFGGNDSVLHFGGTEWISSLLPGKILYGTIGENPNLPHVRIYRVRPDYLTSAFENEINDGEGTFEQIKNQYTKDVIEWPVNEGAPYDDVNGNGIYEPDIDIPGVPGAHQTIWFVSNDAQRPSGPYQNPTNFEIHVTVWAYNTSGPLQNVIFKKYQFINKNDFDINDAYIGIFADFDIGRSTDDLTGCDSLLGLGYAYNADELDDVYKDTSPAIGFDFIQGPLVEGIPSDVGIYNSRKINGYKNLEMTSFVYFTDYIDYFDWPDDENDWYSYMKGINPYTGKNFDIPSEFGGGTTAFAVAGDPVNGNGWIDRYKGYSEDRYLFLSAGPFNISASDTQEIVIAQLVGLGENRLQSVTELKKLDYHIQRLYDEYLYTMPKNIYSKKEIKNVDSRITENRYESSVIVDWEPDPKIENGIINGYHFQGYNVYQFRSDMALKENGIRLTTFDLNDEIKTITENYYDPINGSKVELAEQFGTDSGIQRTFTIEKDYINDEPFIKGKTYYFGVSSYYYYPDWLSQSPLGTFRRSLESDIQLLQVTIREDESGFAYGDTIFAGRVTGLGEGDIYAIVKNPSQLTGHSYIVEFDSVGNKVVWNLVDIVTGNKVLENQTIETERYSYENVYFPSVEGMELHVIQSKPRVAGNSNGIVEVMYGGEPIPPEGWDSKGSQYYGNCVWLDPNWEGSGNRDRYYISAGSYNVIYGLNINHQSNYHDYEIRFTNEENFAVYQFSHGGAKCRIIPFEIWNIGISTPNDYSDDVRMIPIISENENQVEGWWAVIYERRLNHLCSPSILWYGPEDRSSPTTSYDNFHSVCLASGGDNSYYNESLDYSTNKYFRDTFGYVFELRICDYDDDNLPPPVGSTIRINTIKPLSPSDTFIFSTYTNVKEEKLPNSFVLHQNYPNPFNPSTVISYQLSEGGFVKLKVYDILGREIATLVDEYKQAGIYNSIFNSLHSALSSGVYFYTLNVINSSLHPVYQETRKMILLK